MITDCCTVYARPASTVSVWITLARVRLVVEVVSYLSPLMPWIP
jgi:hypothetical protein